MMFDALFRNILLIFERDDGVELPAHSTRAEYSFYPTRDQSRCCSDLREKRAYSDDVIYT